jgi:hypothetical protein
MALEESAWRKSWRRHKALRYPCYAFIWTWFLASALLESLAMAFRQVGHEMRAGCDEIARVEDSWR